MFVSPCVNQYFEVKEGERTNRLTCRGTDQPGHCQLVCQEFNSCRVLSTAVCRVLIRLLHPASGAFGAIFRPSRTSNAESVLNVDPVVHGSPAVERGGSLECRIAGGSVPYPRCQMDYVCGFPNGSRPEFSFVNLIVKKVKKIKMMMLIIIIPII